MKKSDAEEIKNKELMKKMWTIVITDLVIYIIVILSCSYLIKDEKILSTVVIIVSVIAIIIAFYGLKLEIEAGYYECKHCRNRFKIKYLEGFLAPHIHTIRYLKCKECGKRSWCKKLMSKGGK